MAQKMVNHAGLMLNGARVGNLKSFKKDEVEHRAEVDMMDGCGSVERTKKHKFSFDYVIPAEGAKLDWDKVEDATLTVELTGGRRLTYSGVDLLTEGEFTTDGDGEAVMTLSFIAAARNIE